MTCTSWPADSRHPAMYARPSGGMATTDRWLLAVTNLGGSINVMFMLAWLHGPDPRNRRRAHRRDRSLTDGGVPRRDRPRGGHREIEEPTRRAHPEGDMQDREHGRAEAEVDAVLAGLERNGLVGEVRARDGPGLPVD